VPIMGKGGQKGRGGPDRPSSSAASVATSQPHAVPKRAPSRPAASVAAQSARGSSVSRGRGSVCDDPRSAARSAAARGSRSRSKIPNAVSLSAQPRLDAGCSCGLCGREPCEDSESPPFVWLIVTGAMVTFNAYQS
jgi:hypothetical protein